MHTRILIVAALITVFAAPRGAEATTELPSPSADPIASSMSGGGDMPAPGDLHLVEVAPTERAPADEAVAAQWPERGSFWWVVGAIVVGGVILSLLL